MSLRSSSLMVTTPLMKIKGVSVSADLIAEKITEHGRLLGIIRPDEKLVFKEINTDSNKFDYTFERKKVD